MKHAAALYLLQAAVILLAATATAGTAYDGSWSLEFFTRKGSCKPSYRFNVNITNGVVTHPQFAGFNGTVSDSGSVRASVTMRKKHASGSGTLSGTSGRGRWSGLSGNERCSGDWTAHHN